MTTNNPFKRMSTKRILGLLVLLVLLAGMITQLATYPSSADVTTQEQFSEVCEIEQVEPATSSQSSSLLQRFLQQSYQPFGMPSRQLPEQSTNFAPSVEPIIEPVIPWWQQWRSIFSHADTTSLIPSANAAEPAIEKRIGYISGRVFAYKKGCKKNKPIVINYMNIDVYRQGTGASKGQWEFVTNVVTGQDQTGRYPQNVGIFTISELPVDPTRNNVFALNFSDGNDAKKQHLVTLSPAGVVDHSRGATNNLVRHNTRRFEAINLRIDATTWPNIESYIDPVTSRAVGSSAQTGTANNGVRTDAGSPAVQDSQPTWCKKYDNGRDRQTTYLNPGVALEPLDLDGPPVGSGIKRSTQSQTTGCLKIKLANGQAAAGYMIRGSYVSIQSTDLDKQPIPDAIADEDGVIVLPSLPTWTCENVGRYDRQYVFYIYDYTGEKYSQFASKETPYEDCHSTSAPETIIRYFTIPATVYGN